MTKAEIRSAAAHKAHATRRANKAAALTASVGPVKRINGFHPFVCPKCETVEQIITDNAEVRHRCPAFGLKWTTFVQSLPKKEE